MSIANLTKFNPAKNTFSFDSTLQSGILNAMNQNSSSDEEVYNNTFLPIEPFPGLNPIGNPIGGGGDNPYSPANNIDPGEISMDNIKSFFGFNQTPEGEEGEEGEDGLGIDGIMGMVQNFSPVAFAIRNIVAPIRDLINEKYQAYKAKKTEAQNTTTESNTPTGHQSQGSGFNDGGGQTQDGGDSSQARDGGNPAGFS